MIEIRGAKNIQKISPVMKTPEIMVQISSDSIGTVYLCAKMQGGDKWIRIPTLQFTFTETDQSVLFIYKEAMGQVIGIELNFETLSSIRYDSSVKL